MDVLSWGLKPIDGGVFKFAPLHLEARHKALDTPAMVSARARAAQLADGIREGGDVLAALGAASESLKALIEDGLIHFLYLGELWIGTVESVKAGDGEAAIEGPMPPEAVWQAMIGWPDLFHAWEAYATRPRVSASQGNAFALSPNGASAGAQTTAKAAVH